VLRRIDQTDMHLRDQRALAILRSRMNPNTKRSQITVKQLSLELGCHFNTGAAIITRLEGAGQIKRHGSKYGRGGADIEVLDEQ